MYTFEEFLLKAKTTHGDEYEYDANSYKNMATKMWITHKKCGNKFQQSPKMHIRGQGCPECGKVYAKNYHKRNYLKFIEESENRFGDRYSFPNISKEYENSHSKITIVCNLCGRVFTKIACDFITSKTGGCWCEEKSDKTVSYEQIKSITDKFYIEPFDGSMSVKNGVVNCTCIKCGKNNKLKISSLINGNASCKSCVARKQWESRKIPVNEIKMKLDAQFPSIIVDYSNYLNTSQRLSCVCAVCGHKFSRSFNAFQSRKDSKNPPCPKCTSDIINKKRIKTTELFAEQVKSLYGANKYEIVGKYTRSNDKIDVKCLECGRIFSIEANSFLQGHGCPFHNCQSSQKEKDVADFIKSVYNGDIITNDRSVLNGKELDIYLPNIGLAFEFDGVFWHNESNKGRKYHLQKTIECEKNGIRLIHIFEDEWKSKQDIWKSMISNIIGLTKKKIYARECEICEISPKICTKFLNENHIQGWCPSQIKIGLIHSGELVAVMTFGKSRHFVGNGRSEFELLRFCNKADTIVVGGASKLFTYFKKTYKPSSVISYADRRWSNGNMYNKIGFKFDHYSKPNYYYVIGDIRKNRFNFRKSVLVRKYGCPTDMSESEFCKKQKWNRIYDCGTAVYKWFNKD